MVGYILIWFACLQGQLSLPSLRVVVSVELVASQDSDVVTVDYDWLARLVSEMLYRVECVFMLYLFTIHSLTAVCFT